MTVDEPTRDEAHDNAHDDALEAVRGSRAAVAGVVFSALFVVGWLLLRSSPSLDDSDATIVDYYADAGNRRASSLAGLYVVPFAAIAFTWFLAALRDRYVRASVRENTLLSTVHLVAGALFVASLFIVSATELALVWLADQADGAIDISSARAVLALGEANADIMALRSAAVFVAVSSTRAVRSGLFPRVYALIGLLIAVTLLLVYDNWPVTALLVPAWVGASSIIVLMARPHRELSSGN
jgi:Na+/melibiose symporter-like transporter